MGASSYYQLWPDVDLAMAIFQGATRRVTTGTAFDVSATMCDTLCRVSCNVSRDDPPMSPARLDTLWIAALRTGAVLPLCPYPRESWDPNPAARSVSRPRVSLRSRAMKIASSHHAHT